LLLLLLQLQLLLLQLVGGTQQLMLLL